MTKIGMPKKRVEKRLRDLLDKKSEIHQPGRLITHLINELALGSSSSSIWAHDLIAEVLDSMARKGIVTLDKSGHVFNGVKLTTRLRTESVSNEPVRLSSIGEPAIEFACPEQPVKEKNFFGTTSIRPTAVNIKVDLMQTSEVSSPLDVVTQLTEKIEDLKSQHGNCDTNLNRERESGQAKLVEAKAEYEARFSQLKRDIATCRETIATGAKAVKALQRENERLKADNDKLERDNSKLQADLAAAQNLSGVAARVAAALS